MALPRLIFTILMIMSNVPSVYPYLASPSAGILLAAGRARATPRSGRAPTSCWHPCHRPVRGRGQRAPASGGRGQRRRRGAPGNAALAALLRTEDCRVIEADPAGEGMGTSLATAARHLLALPDTPRSVLVALADMPWIRHASMAGVLDALQHAPMAAPSHRGRRGHPVGFRADLLLGWRC